jgi:hypothetical protein
MPVDKSCGRSIIRRREFHINLSSYTGIFGPFAMNIARTTGIAKMKNKPQRRRVRREAQRKKGRGYKIPSFSAFSATLR